MAAGANHQHHPIAFVQVGGLETRSVDNLTGSKANATGFTNFEFDLAGKWLQILKQMAPRVTWVAVLRSPGIRTGRSWPVPLTLAWSLNVDVNPVDLGLEHGDGAEIEHSIAEFAEMPDGGLIVLPSSF